MSQELIYSALYAALGLTDSVLQIWITLTFAVIVSTYVAGKRFDRQVYWLLTGLYAMASIILMIRFGSAAFQAFYYKDMLAARGFEAWPVPTIVSIVIGGGSFFADFRGHSRNTMVCAGHSEECGGSGDFVELLRENRSEVNQVIQAETIRCAIGFGLFRRYTSQRRRRVFRSGEP